ncbi:hypothetical protein FOA43_004529 [Brettanomyces nanus]|uniref:RecQ mediated genome instability protein 1 OB-fold domain-containing protein n=1 Tax=Eeniella nana TaxID=13502 RepID=A0A875SAP7_EENNA|nr:uncharacterized protein FOA43_004529 [Brettanomyces nanus]QPG77125.1 hypothetical protein FOA43_004529 [Brettanomyces nanus]
MSNIRYIETLTQLIDINTSFADTQHVTSVDRVIRAVDVENTTNATDYTSPDSESRDDDLSINPNRRFFKLTLQDAIGSICYGFEFESLKFLHANNSLYPVPLGSKLIVKEGLTTVTFDCLQLTNLNTEYLGGEIDRMNFQLYERELSRLKKEINYKG